MQRRSSREWNWHQCKRKSDVTKQPAKGAKLKTITEDNDLVSHMQNVAYFTWKRYRSVYGQSRHFIYTTTELTD